MKSVISLFEKLFANEYFGIILFCIIAVLVLLFIITLFFGLTDTKEKNEIKKQKLEEDKDLFFKIDDNVKLDIPKVESELNPGNDDDNNIELPKIKNDNE